MIKNLTLSMFID